MSSLLIAFCIAIFAILSSAYLLTTAGVPKEVAGSISTTIMGSVPFIREALEKRKQLAKPDGQSDLIVTLSGYGLPMTRLILYGWLFMLASLEFASTVGGVIAGLGEIKTEYLMITIVLVTSITAWPAIFFVGRWIGKRCISHGILTVVITAFIARLSGSLVDIIIMPTASYEEFFGKLSLGKFSLHIIAGTILFSIFALIGYWRGRHQRLAAYLHYLMKQVSPNDREAIVELVYEEARKSSQ